MYFNVCVQTEMTTHQSRTLVSATQVSVWRLTLTLTLGVCLASWSWLLGSSQPLTERQRQNMQLMRSFAAQADIITDDIASVVNTEYLALPRNDSVVMSCQYRP